MLSINQLSFDSLFSSARPSYIHVSPTNPRNTDASTADTIALMDSHALAAASHPLIQEAVEEIESNAKSSDREDLIEATYEYVQEHVSFTEDEELLNQMFGIEEGVELLITPPRLLSMHNPKGDCDDFSMLTKALLLAQGIQTSFTTIAADRDNPDKWSHVYLTDDDTLTAIDTSHGKYVGWEAPIPNRKTAWRKQEQGLREMIVQDNQTPNYGHSVEHISSMGLQHRHKFNGGIGSLGELGECMAYDTEGNCTYDDNTGSLSVNNSIGVTSSTFDWGRILAPLTQAGSSILKAQFGQPQLAPGTFIRGADGSILTNQPISGGLPLTAGLGSGVGTGTLIAIAAVVALLAFKK